jgi:hypothetical protein
MPILLEEIPNILSSNNISSNISSNENNRIKESENKLINLLENIINDKYTLVNNNNNWINSKFKFLTLLQINDRGYVGEEYLKSICDLCDIPNDICGIKYKKTISGDGLILYKSVEIKTAYLGNQKSFQHELGENPWNTDFLVFIDITYDDNIYITFIKNFTKEFYLNDKDKYCVPYFAKKKFIQRKKSGNFKFDTTVKLNEHAVKNNLSIKISKDIDISKIKEYILQQLTK